MSYTCLHVVVVLAYPNRTVGFSIALSPTVGLSTALSPTVGFSTALSPSHE